MDEALLVLEIVLNFFSHSIHFFILITLLDYGHLLFSNFKIFYLFILGEKYVAVRKPRAKVCFLLPPSGCQPSWLSDLDVTCSDTPWSVSSTLVFHHSVPCLTWSHYLLHCDAAACSPALFLVRLWASWQWRLCLIHFCIISIQQFKPKIFA